MAATVETKLASCEPLANEHAPDQEFLSLSDGTVIAKEQHAICIAGLKLPYTTLYPTEKDLGTHTLITPGLGGTEVTTMPLAAELVKTGHTVTTFDPPRGHLLHAFGLRSLLHPDHLLSQVTYGVAKDLHGTHGAQDIQLIGHSMGGPAVTTAAEMIAKKLPDAISSVTLLAPAGATGHNLMELAPRAAHVIKEELLPNWDLLKQNLEDFTSEAELIVKSMLYALRNPLRTIGETYMVTRADLRPGLQKLAQLGIETTGIFPCNDLFFDCERAEATIGTAVDNFVVLDSPTDAGHLSPQLYPKDTVRAQSAKSTVVTIRHAEQLLAA